MYCIMNTEQTSLSIINGMFKVLQKLLKCFNGTTILRFFLVFVFSCLVFSPTSRFAFDVFPVILLLYLKDYLWDLHYNYLQENHEVHLCDNFINFLLFFYSFYCTQANYTLALQHLNLPHCQLIHY